jgi:hypothetical protein
MLNVSKGINGAKHHSLVSDCYLLTQTKTLSKLYNNTKYLKAYKLKPVVTDISTGNNLSY